METLFIIIISGISILLMILSNIFKPEITIGKTHLSTFWMAPLLGAILLISTGLLDINAFFSGLTKEGTINPLEILGLFFSMTFMSIILDEVGFFERIASLAAKKAKGSQIVLFLILYVLTSILTIFTSNDIIIITFTPFIIFFTKRAKIDPIPYLINEFVAANTWSLLFIIGNPTNIYIASTFDISFFEYLSHMYLGTILSGITSLTIMLLLFKKRLKKPIEEDDDVTTIKDKFILIVSLIFLGSTIVLMAISSYINFKMWLVSTIMALSLLVILVIYGIFHKESFKTIGGSIKRLPFNLIPFIISMFAIVLAFEASGLSLKLSNLLSNNYPILTYGLSSFLVSNLINNIPMSILYTSIISNVDSSIISCAIYSSIAGSNIGAFLTPLGALAGVMWGSIIKKHEIKFSFIDFIKYGVLISVPSIFAALLGIFLTL